MKRKENSAAELDVKSKVKNVFHFCFLSDNLRRKPANFTLTSNSNCPLIDKASAAM